MSNSIEQAYTLAQERYAALGVDTDAALEKLATIPISLHCWQGDDVIGFEDPDRGLSGGIMATGNYPGKARTPDELRQDLDMAYSLIPGTHRLNLHAIYGDSDGAKLDRNDWQPHHFDKWIAWAKENNHGIDFNPTCFSHPMADSGFTLASLDQGVRDFWIEHCRISREIGAHIGEQLGTPCVTNVWIPDGYKDTPANRRVHRELLVQSLDEVFAAPLDPRHNLDAVEAKLFGIGSESYVVGSHEFYMGYATSRQTLLCLDAGHFHPTETIADKISSVMLYVPELLLHVSRGVRWDSDHVVTLTDELQAIMQELVRGNFLVRTHIGLDFFDASINRVAAWTIGTRNAVRALLMALLEPTEHLQKLEASGDFTSRLALLEELKGMPFGAVWDQYCQQQNVPVGYAFMDEIRTYEKQILAQRG
ncbi:MAG: L-rhamnose isomerase [Ardenticatenaceae bacterium]|nr:L-rhamnose isomerase [Ardenticatenaceae bacterium]